MPAAAGASEAQVAGARTKPTVTGVPIVNGEGPAKVTWCVIVEVPDGNPKKVCDRSPTHSVPEANGAAALRESLNHMEALELWCLRNSTVNVAPASVNVVSPRMLP